MQLYVLVIWLFLSTLVGLWAGRRGRDPAAWGALSIVISPLLTWLTLLAIGPGNFEE
jgi:hypothetical protein